MTDEEKRSTEPGPVLKTYERLRAKLSGLVTSAKTETAALVSTATAGTNKAITEAERDWKTKPAEEVESADVVRSQAEMKEAFGDDAPTTAVYEDVVSEPAGVTADAAKSGAENPTASPTPQADAGLPAENAAAPDLEALDQAALAKLAEAETGSVPSDGLGLNDGPSVAHPSDLER